jgi:hypothetical protein
MLLGWAKKLIPKKKFRFMKLEESMAGEDSKPEGMNSELAGTNFTIRKKNPMKIPEFKRSGIKIIAEFRRIPNGFPNQGGERTRTASIDRGKLNVVK